AKTLYRLYKSPGKYLELLKERGDLLTEVARKKSYAAVSRAILAERIAVPARYVINRAGGSISLLRLQAVLLFAQIVSLALYGVELFDEDYRPDRGHLPYKGLTQHFLDNGCFVLEIPEGALSDAEREITDSVADAFEWYGPRAIEALLAAEHARFFADPNASARRYVSKERLKRCYRELFEKNSVRTMKDFEGYLHKRMTGLRHRTAQAAHGNKPLI
ncbi:MAG: hypothetical protein ILP10_00560, partial [Lachnospiraceae bacterium]|nr:hypothetical protein [Lachnospiraceae bacterium]